MEINKDVLYPYLLYDSPIPYGNIILYPVLMKDILSFQLFTSSITVRKNSVFSDKKIIKMTYLDFLFYCHNNNKLSEEYKIKDLPFWYEYSYELLKLVCKDQEVLVGKEYGSFMINGIEINSDIFDVLRKIIIIQNDIDFDINEFMNYEAEQALNKARNLLEKDNSTIEDYIDSYAIATKSRNDEIMNLSIRKFNRYIKRLNMYDDYKISMSASMSGMVTFKNPIRHWMIMLENKDRYETVKTNSEEFNEIKDKIG